MPASLTVLAKRVPTPTGPSVTLRISWTRGLNFGSFSPSAGKAKTSSIGRATTVVASKRPAMRADPNGLLDQAGNALQRRGDLAGHVDDDVGAVEVGRA